MAVSNLDRFKGITFSIFIIIQVLIPVGHAKEISFSKAKSLLKSKVYGRKAETFYCKCKYQKNSIKLKTCSVQTKKYRKRKKRVEWEHIVPAHAFGQAFKEWRDKDKFCPKIKSRRKCSAKKNPLFRAMEGDLHNLVPSVGAINALRSNLSFAEFGEKGEELCRKRFWKNGRKVNVAEDIKGDIARIYFYMNDKYPGKGIISNKNKSLFASWNKIDPVTKEECEISKLKSKLQGSRNRFVEDYCK